MAVGGDSIGRFLPQQVESSAALHRLFPCRLDRFLERRLPGFNPVSKSLAKHAYRTEFHCTAFHQLLASFGSTLPLWQASALREARMRKRILSPDRRRDRARLSTAGGSGRP